MRSRVPFLIGLVLGGVLSGCGPSEPPPELPPPPSERGEFGDRPSHVSRSTSIVLILPATTTFETTLLAEGATKEAGIQKVLLETRQPRPDDPPTAQADLIQQAARDGASVLIVLVNSDTPLAAAIDAVQREGTPVVVVGDTLQCETSPHRVDTVSFQKAATEMVRLAIGDVRRESLELAEPPLLLIREVDPDSHAEERIEALEAALAEAGHEPIRVKYAESTVDAANALEAALKQHPRTALVFADSDQATLGSVAVVEQHARARAQGDPPPFIHAGYLCDPTQVNSMKISGSMAGFIDWNVPGIARTAVRDAIRLSRGEKLPELSEVPTPVIRPQYASPRVRPTVPEERLDQ